MLLGQAGHLIDVFFILDTILDVGLSLNLGSQHSEYEDRGLAVLHPPSGLWQSRRQTHALAIRRSRTPWEVTLQSRLSQVQQAKILNRGKATRGQYKS